MLHKSIFFFLIISPLLFFSCRSYKDYTYLQDVGDNQNFLRSVPKAAPPYLIRKNDNFEAIIEKEQEIVRLKKTIQELEGKYDGQHLNERKIKK